MHWRGVSEPLVAWLFPVGARDEGGAGVAFARVTEETRKLRLDLRALALPKDQR